MFRTGAQMCILVLLTGLLLLREAHWHPVASVDEAFGDGIARADRRVQEFMVARHWRAAPATAPVVLVAIDASSLAEHAWPWTPLDYSLFVQSCSGFRPEVTAIHEVLDWDRTELSKKDRENMPLFQRMLRNSLLRSSKVLLGQRLGWPEDPDAAPPLQETPLLRRVTGNLRALPEWTVIEAQAKEEYRLSSTVGYTNLPDDSSARTFVPLVLRYQGQVVPTFVLQAVTLWQRLSPDDVEVVLGSHIQVGPKLRIPIDAHGRMRVNFGAPLTVMGVEELLAASEQVAAKQQPIVPVEKITGSITLLARTDPGSETVPQPLRGPISKGEFFAAAIATIQSRSFIAQAPAAFELILVGVAALAGFWIPRLRRRPVALGCLAALVLYLLASVLVYHFWMITLPLVLPAGLLLFLALYRAATPNYVWRLREPVIL